MPDVKGSLTRLEVPMVQTQSPALLSFQFWQQLPDDPWLIVGVVGNKGVILSWSLPVFMLCVKEQSQEEVVGVDQLPPQEMVGEGCHHKQEDRNSGGDKADEFSVHGAGLDIKVQQLHTFKVFRVVAHKVVGIKNLCLLACFYPLSEPGVIAVTGETIALKIQVNKSG